MRALRASEIYADDPVRIVAIEAVHCDAQKSGRIYRLFARLEAAAIVVCAGGNKRFIGLNPVVASLPELEREVPGLRELLTGNSETGVSDP